jgi:hypothetical protein
MKMMTIQLTAVSQFENPLTNFKRSTINLIKEQADRLFTSSLEPIRRIEARAIAVNAGKSAIAVNAGKTNKIPLGHLAGTPLNYRKVGISSQLVDNLALADAVTSTKKNRQAGSTHCWCQGNEGFEVNSHNISLPYNTILSYYGYWSSFSASFFTFILFFYSLPFQCFSLVRS